MNHNNSKMMSKLVVVVFGILFINVNVYAQTKNQAPIKTAKPTKAISKKSTVVDSVAFKANQKRIADSLSLNKPLEWQTNVFRASELATAQNKTIFAFFTGSDWCGWCTRLQNNVFKKTEFIQWANKNVILLELDFPRSKQLPAELTQQNNELRQAFQVQGYPTIWLFNLQKDSTTNKVNVNAYGSLGYPPSAEPGKEEVSFLKTANEILSKKAM
jgi:thioredoxin-related protein